MDELYFNNSTAQALACVNNFTAPYNLTKKELYEKVLSDIKEGDTTINPDLYRAYSENLKRAVSGVLQSGQYGDKYFDMQQQFEANLSRFAAYKAYHATQLLQQHDDPQTQKAILNTFNRYQAAEYNTAIARARTAKQWDDFTSNSISNELYPNIKWLPSRSANPREEHRVFWNMVWAKDDPFWSENQPGNLWNCKCDWEETDEPVTGGTYDYQPPAGLEGNPAQTGEIFTDNASYFNTGNEQEIEKKYKSFSRENWQSKISQLYNKTILTEIENTPVKIGFDKTGLRHYLHDLYASTDYILKNNLMPFLDKVIANGKLVAREDNTVFLNPEASNYKKRISKFFYFQIQLPNKNNAIISISKFSESDYRLYAISDRLRETAVLY